MVSVYVPVQELFHLFFSVLSPSRQFSIDSSAAIPTVLGTPVAASSSYQTQPTDVVTIQQQKLQQQWEQEQKQLQAQFQRKQTQLYQQQQMYQTVIFLIRKFEIMDF